MRILIAGLFTAGLLVAGASQVHADDTAKAMIQRAVQAHGGAANLAKLWVRQEKSKTTSEINGETHLITDDVLTQLPDRQKRITEVVIQGRKSTNVFVFNGEKGWANFGRQTIELGMTGKGGRKETLYRDRVRTLTPLLKDQGFTLSPLGEAQVNDRPALGVRVAAKDHFDFDLFFDKENGLLVRSGFQFQHNQQVVINEVVYGDYKETGGLNWPRKHVYYRDNAKVGEVEITELKFLERIDDSEFEKP